MQGRRQALQRRGDLILFLYQILACKGVEEGGEVDFVFLSASDTQGRRQTFLEGVLIS